MNYASSIMFHASIILAILLAPDRDIVVKWKRVNDVMGGHELSRIKRPAHGGGVVGR